MSIGTQGRTSAHPTGAVRPGRSPRTPPSTPDAPVAFEPNPRSGPALRVVADPDDPPEHLFRRLLSAYLGGVGILEVVEAPALSRGTCEVAREFARRTRGSQLDTGERRRLTITLPPAPASESVDRLVRRLGAQVVQFHRDAVESWRGLPLGDEDLWDRKDDEIDREAWYLERILALAETAVDPSPRATTVAFTVARSLERIGDHAVALGEAGRRLASQDGAGPLLSELRQFHDQALHHLEEVLASPDGSQANELLDVGEALAVAGRTLAERLLPAVGDRSMSPASAAAVGRALEAIGRTVAYSQDIAQAFFDRAIVPRRGTARTDEVVPVAS